MQSRPYEVELSASARRDLHRLPRTVQDRVLRQLRSLAGNPRPTGVRKLTDSDNVYRVRVGDYRVVFTVDDSIRNVSVLRIGHRSDVY